MSNKSKQIGRFAGAPQLGRDAVGCAYCRGEIDHVRLGIKMSLLRKNAGMSQKRLGEILGVSASYLGDLEHGRRNWTAQREADFRTACTDFS